MIPSRWPHTDCPQASEAFSPYSHACDGGTQVELYRP
jgi:hypothetical protein